MNLKTTLLYLTLVCFSFGCYNMYPKEKKAGLVQDTVVTATYQFFLTDTTDRSPKVIYLCDFDVKKPYSLIQWNDGTYGILYKMPDGGGNWYKVINEKAKHDFTSILEQGEHFKDSCSAKENLQQFLDSRITYKIVK